MYFGICMPCLLGELCAAGQREQGAAQITACEQLQNRSARGPAAGGGDGGDDASGGGGGGFMDGIMANSSSWFSNATMVIPGTNLSVLYVPPPPASGGPPNAASLAMMCYNSQPCPSGQSCPDPSAGAPCTVGSFCSLGSRAPRSCNLDRILRQSPAESLLGGVTVIIQSALYSRWGATWLASKCEHRCVKSVNVGDLQGSGCVISIRDPIV